MPSDIFKDRESAATGIGVRQTASNRMVSVVPAAPIFIASSKQF
jgi:hypothetical protein